MKFYQSTTITLAAFLITKTNMGTTIFLGILDVDFLKQDEGKRNFYSCHSTEIQVIKIKLKNIWDWKIME